MFESFLVEFTFLLLPAAVNLKIIDQSGNFDLNVDKNFSCGSNFTVLINDAVRAAYVQCDGNTFSPATLEKCTGFLDFVSLTLKDCLLLTPHVKEVLGNYRPECFFLISKDVSPGPEVIIKDVPGLSCIFLFVMKNVSYELQDLPNLHYLDLINVREEELPKKLVSSLSSLTNINIIRGDVRFLPEDTFGESSGTVVLNLIQNGLEQIPEKLFNGMTSLQSLSLTGNLLTFLPPAIFDQLVSLQELTLAENRLNSLSPDLLRNNFNLLHLDISNNSLSFLPELLLRNTPELEVFQACNCSLTALPEKIFAFSTVLRVISVCGNKLSRLPPDVFANNPVLFTIHLQTNRLTELPAEVFHRNLYLNILDLSDNRLQTVPHQALLKLRFLRALYLMGNQITEVEERHFNFMKNLKFLFLNRNFLRSLPSHTPFGRLPHLIKLGLANNNFSHFPRIDWSAYDITHFTLDHNHLSVLRAEDLPPDNNSFVSLSNNNISTVEGRVTRNMRRVLLHDNPFRCDCDLIDFIDSTRSSNISPFCRSPPRFENKSLFDISPSYIFCPVEEDCPERCECYRQRDRSVIVNCSSSGISRIPSLPPNTTIVHLEHNFLVRMQSTDTWSRVTRLYLDHNRLDPSTDWNFPASLEFLSLRYNGLQRLSAKFLKYVSKAPYFLLDIRNNPFKCDCSSVYLKSWFDQNIEKMVGADGVTCSRLLPNNTEANIALVDVPADAFCLEQSPIVNIAVLVSACVAFLAISFAVLCVVLFTKYRTTVLAYLYVHFPIPFCFDVSELDGDKMYDAFVSYTGNDRDIAFCILKELEEKPPFFKLCIHERDWMPGIPIVSHIENSVLKSRKTVVVFSEDFSASTWCEMEFQMAHMQSLEDRTERLIVVLRDPSVRHVVPSKVRNLLATKTYLIWGERWFWEKLRYALPHYSRQQSVQPRV